MTLGDIDAASGARTASNSGIMYELDLKTGDLQWSDALYVMLGYSKSEPFNRQEWWIGHIHPDDAMKLNQAMDRLSDPKTPGWTVEYRFRSGDGSYRTMRDQASIIRDGDNMPIQIIGTLTPAA